MFNDPELNDLSEAVKVSPENVYLRLMFIRKLKEKGNYNEELENQSLELLKYKPDHTEVKEILARAYFDSGKTSASIIIGEELRQKNLLSASGCITLAKAYLKEGSMDISREIYIEILEMDPDYSDDELDAAFRIPSDFEDSDEYEDGANFLEKPSINFDDVGGMDDIKKEIDLKIIKPLEHQELYASYGKKIGGGILLYGPPGCGKTFLARATAGQINADFINVGLNDILDMWLGNSVKNLRSFFETARQNTPCVMFIDEIDALGAKRSDQRQSAGKNVINQFLAELDGIESSNEGVLVIGATNAPWHVDTAFRRPGRFDRIIFVPPPDIKSKAAILQLKLAGKPIKNIDYKQIAKKAKMYSGADINAIVDLAVEEKLIKAMETGVADPITTNDLLNAMKKHRASTIDWFTTAKNYALFANQSGLYDDILKYID